MVRTSGVYYSFRLLFAMASFVAGILLLVQHFKVNSRIFERTRVNRTGFFNRFNDQFWMLKWTCTNVSRSIRRFVMMSLASKARASWRPTFWWRLPRPVDVGDTTGFSRHHDGGGFGLCCLRAWCRSGKASACNWTRHGMMKFLAGPNIRFRAVFALRKSGFDILHTSF